MRFALLVVGTLALGSMEHLAAQSLPTPTCLQLVALPDSTIYRSFDSALRQLADSTRPRRPDTAYYGGPPETTFVRLEAATIPARDTVPIHRAVRLPKAGATYDPTAQGGWFSVLDSLFVVFQAYGAKESWKVALPLPASAGHHHAWIHVGWSTWGRATIAEIGCGPR